LLFDYAWTIEAAGEHPPDERARFILPMVEHVLEARRGGGGFLDNPINGMHYGTGMALEALVTAGRWLP